MWAVTQSGIDPQATGARGAGLATVVSGAAGLGGTVLDTWFPAPELIPALAGGGTVRLSLAEA
jgi:2,3,4,5-tetrahydropyridine-2-carboxylate N-succinyltransferase